MPDSKVNIRKLILTTRENYQIPEGEEWRITVNELIANAIDSNATWVKINFNQESLDNFTIICEDNGKGITRESFEKYHDIYTISKSRKSGTIGFAGIGAKLTLDLCKKVITETKSNQGKFYLSEWFLLDENSLANQRYCKICGHLINPDIPHFDIIEKDIPTEMNNHEGTYVKIIGLKTKNLTEKNLENHVLAEYQYAILLKKIEIYLNERKLNPVLPKENEFEFEYPFETEFNISEGDLGSKKIIIKGHFYFVNDAYINRLREINYDEIESGIDIVVYGKRIEREQFNIILKTRSVDSQYIYGFVEYDQLIDIVKPSKDQIDRKKKLWNFFESKINMELENWLKRIGKYDEKFWSKMDKKSKEITKFIDIVQKQFSFLLNNFFGNNVPQFNKDKSNGDNTKGNTETMDVLDSSGGRTGNIIDGGTIGRGIYGGKGDSEDPSVPNSLRGVDKGVKPDESGGEHISEKKFKYKKPNINIYIDDLPNSYEAVIWDGQRNSFVINESHPGFKFTGLLGERSKDLYIIMEIIDYLINNNEEISSDELKKKEMIYNLYNALLSPK